MNYGIHYSIYRDMQPLGKIIEFIIQFIGICNPGEIMEFIIQFIGICNPWEKIMEFIIQFIGICNPWGNYGIHYSIYRDMQPLGKIMEYIIQFIGTCNPWEKLWNTSFNL